MSRGDRIRADRRAEKDVNGYVLGMSTSPDRAAQLAAAALVYGLLREAMASSPLGQRPPYTRENALIYDVWRAQFELDRYRKIEALKLTLTAVLPGWKDIDASNVLPQKAWWAFVSNDKEEWRTWLQAQGLTEAVIEDLFGQVDWAC